MQYRLAPLFCRPWTLNGITPRLIESHYERNYGGELRRLNAISRELEALDPATTPPEAIARLKRDEAAALNSTLLHELYFASLGGDGRAVPEPMAEALTRDFGSVEGLAPAVHGPGRRLAGGSGWVLLTWLPRDGRLINIGLQRGHAGPRGRRADPGARHVRARLPHRLRRQRRGLYRRLHAQHRLGRGAGPLRGRDQGRAAASARAEGVRRYAGGQSRGGEGHARGRRGGADHRRPAAPLHARGPRTSWKARCGAIPNGWRTGSASCQARCAGRHLLRLRLPHRLPDGDRAAQGGLRRALHGRRPLRAGRRSAARSAGSRMETGRDAETSLHRRCLVPARAAPPCPGGQPHDPHRFRTRPSSSGRCSPAGVARWLGA